MISEYNVATVSDLVSTIKEVLEENFSEVMVQGEVTNLSLSGSGHWYFSLSDSSSSLSCALFKGDVLRNPLIRNLKDGDKIIVSGPISLYQKRGSFQLIAKRIFPAGEGQLKLQFERLKAKLAQEGLFDLERKKTIPLFPKRIGIITAEHGAALQDFLNVMTRRSLWHDILIVPAIVQGDEAPRSLIKALKAVQSLPGIEVIVFAHGGGSLEDLWAFNDENLVRAISLSTIPIISAVGHQVDFTLCDYVADLRSETPTAAAEILSQPQTELNNRLMYCQSHLKSCLFKMFQFVELMIQKFHPQRLLAIMNSRTRDLGHALNRLKIESRGNELVGLKNSEQKLNQKFTKLNHAYNLHQSRLQDKVERLGQVLEALGPSQVLKRGYSYIRSDSGSVTHSFKEFKGIVKGAKLEIQFYDGVGLVQKD